MNALESSGADREIRNLLSNEFEALAFRHPELPHQGKYTPLITLISS